MVDGSGRGRSRDVCHTSGIVMFSVRERVILTPLGRSDMCACRRRLVAVRILPLYADAGAPPLVRPL